MNKKPAELSDIVFFKTKIDGYKKLLDGDIAAFVKRTQDDTLRQYGESARLATDAYLSVLGRGGKRIRGALVMLGYEMSGGKDRKMILEAARAIEMMHAYILIIDDIQDRSPIRRGGPTANVMLADYHREHHLAGDPGHFGMSLAINAALTGAHAAQVTLANLPGADDKLRLKAVSIMNRTMLATTHGQTNDIMNEVVPKVSQEQLERVLEWKTALYSVINPLQVGMVLAGADDRVVDAITPYATHAGKAFQISDDILSIFAQEFESGKSPLDDIREGKRTVLTVHALNHAKPADREFLGRMLGNPGLTQDEFDRCKDIIKSSGGLDHARQQTEKHVRLALEALKKVQDLWTPEGVSFLRGLTQYLLSRKS